MDKRPYRPCAGFMLANKHSQIFVGQRIDTEYQMHGKCLKVVLIQEKMPRLGIRELKEETGVGRELVKVISRTKNLSAMTYLLNLCQIVGWYVSRARTVLVSGKFTGKDSDINLKPILHLSSLDGNGLK